jgi:hypothetical protein
MKKLFFIGVLCLSLATAGFSMGFSIKATGGLSLLMGGDYNTIVADQNALAHTLTGSTVDTEFSKLGMGLDFGGEFILLFTDSMGIGLGAGYITASKESTLGLHDGAFSWSRTYTPSVSAIPFTLNFHFFLPLGSSLRLHFFAGPGLYLTTVKFDDNTTIPTWLTNYTQSFTPDSKLVFGFQGGLGIEIGLSRNIALLLDTAGRYVNISGLTGPWELTGTFLSLPIPPGTTGTGTFYYAEAQDGGVYYAYQTVRTTVPSGPTIRNAREGSFSLSGIQFQTGIRISF